MFSMPFPSLESTFPICDIEHDMGIVVKSVFDQGAKANGKLFPVVSEFIQVPYTLYQNISDSRRNPWHRILRKVPLLLLLLNVYSHWKKSALQSCS